MERIVSGIDLVAIIKKDVVRDGLEYYYHILKEPRGSEDFEVEDFYNPSPRCLFVFEDDNGDLWMTIGNKGHEVKGYNDEHIWFEHNEVILHRCTEVHFDDEYYEDPIFTMTDINSSENEELNDEYLELQQEAYDRTKMAHERTAQRAAQSKKAQLSPK